MPMNNNKIAQWLHVLWLLPGIWLVGCTADNGAAPVDDTGRRPIAFSVSTEAPADVTRGFLLNELDAEFGLFCAKYDDDEWGDEGQPLNFMYNEMVIGSDDSWSTSEGYFVPKTENLKFFAYYPYYDDVRFGNSPIRMYGDEYMAYPIPAFTYTMPQDVDEQLDLMYAISDQVHADNEGKLGTVHLHFRHLLTAISVVARSSETCTLKRITLKNLYRKGEFEFVDGGVLRADPTETDGDGFGEVYANLNIKLKSTYNTVGSGKSFMLILQPLDDDGNPKLNQEASMWVTIEAGGKEYVFKKSLADLATSLTSSKNTQLNLSVESLKRITVRATITNWGHGANFYGAVSDQPTLELEPLISDWEGEDDNTTNITTGPKDSNP